MNKASMDVAIYGTEEAPVVPQLLTAGPLSAELEGGNLRHIRFAGIEIIRAISFIVRDRDWGTCVPRLGDVRLDAHADRTELAYSASIEEKGQRLSYEVRITCTPHELSFSAEAHALTDFTTNRTGFVVLHPLAGVVGHAATVEHVDGSIEEVRFPESIAPLQPMMNLRAITHEPASGLAVSCRMEGDSFEMEDQRNWTDASFKTYVRPLALPWPYTLARGQTVRQKIALSVRAAGALPEPAAGPVRLSIGRAGAVIPPVGVGMGRGELAHTHECLARLAPLQPRHLLYHFDPRTGTIDDLRQAAAIAHALHAEPWLEVVVESVDRFEEELAELGQAHAGIGAPFRVVLVSPVADMKATLPGSPWPPAAPLAQLHRAARRAFPGARIGGGMFSFFTELNRKRPPLDDIDVVTFTTVANFHAGDDATVVENLQSLPSLTLSARRITRGKPFVAGPSAIGMRMNPYGEAPVRNLANTRVAMAENDPRQRGLLGAAWALGYAAHMARGGAAAVTLGGTTGAQGVLHAPQPWPQPFYDDAGGYFPVFHVQRALAALAGRERREVNFSRPDVVEAFAAQNGDEAVVLVANLTASTQVVELPFEIVHSTVLDATNFVAASLDAFFLDKAQPGGGRSLVLNPFAVVRLTADTLESN